MNRPVPPPLTREPGAPLARPFDAATLIIYRATPKGLEVLMGERHAKHKFMPNRYVFPGGRVDPNDSRVRVASPLRSDTASQLERRLKPARARAAAVAAIRETFEETGLIIGGEDPLPHRPPPAGWSSFFEAGFAPALDHLTYIGRAVTPPIRPLRFNARFFVVEHENVTGEVQDSRELLGLRWFTIDETLELELAMITRRVLAHFRELHQAGRHALEHDRPIPYFKWTPDGHVLIDE